MVNGVQTSTLSVVAGVNDILNGNEEYGILSTEARMEKGRLAIQALADYTEAKNNGDTELAQLKAAEFKENYPHFGYGFFKDKEEIVPNVKLTFYAFHTMVGLGLLFGLLFLWLIYASYKGIVEKYKWVLHASVWSILFGYIASELGWIVAEMGRQPWTIQDILPVGAATSQLNVGNVQTTFFIFLVLFTVLFIAEIKILTAQIKKGPEEGGSHV
jgi:cytochrome d ubiquinol oxidase subunit I